VIQREKLSLYKRVSSTHKKLLFQATPELDYVPGKTEDSNPKG
jgi:hypothetical protein